jgi:hypothetical protein
MVNKLVRLYPARWRERYGQEMTWLLADLSPLSRAARLRIGLDLLRGAADAHLSGGLRGPGGAARAIGVASGATVIGWLPVGALIVLSTVFPSGLFGGIATIGGFFYLMAAFPAIGALASRACARPGAWLAACATSGAIMAVLFTATYSVIDNAYFGIVSRDPENIAAFRASGMTSMRNFINLSLERQALTATILFVVIGVLMGHDRRDLRRRTAATGPRLKPFAETGHNGPDLFR